MDNILRNDIDGILAILTGPESDRPPALVLDRSPTGGYDVFLIGIDGKVFWSHNHDTLKAALIDYASLIPEINPQNNLGRSIP